MAGSKTTTTVDTTKNFVIVENSNVFGEERKDLKGLLDIQPFVLYVEVPYETADVNTMKLELAAKVAAEGAVKDARKQLADLVKELEKLQKKEKEGDEKASTMAEKKVKSAEAKLKDAPADINGAIRKAVEKALTVKKRLRSVGRSYFRGMKLAKDAFKTDPEVDLEQPAETLEEAGDQLAADSKKEKELREDLIEAMEKLATKLTKDKAKLGAPKAEWEKVLEEFESDISKLEKDADAYDTFLTKMKKDVETALEGHRKLFKKVQSDDKLKKETKLKGLMKDFKNAADTIEDQMASKQTALKKLQSLRRTLEKFDKGQEWTRQIDAMKSLKSTLKSGKAAEDAAEQLALWVDKN